MRLYHGFDYAYIAYNGLSNTLTLKIKCTLCKTLNTQESSLQKISNGF